MFHFLRAVLRLIQKLHIYAGLQSCIALLLFAVAGFATTWHQRPGAPKRVPEVREVSFAAPEGASDRQLADLIYDQLQLPLSSRVADWALAHDEHDQLRIEFYTPNGVTRVTHLADQRRLRLEQTRVDLGTFLSNMHALTPSPPGRGTPLLLVLFSLYVEFSIFSLFFLSLTGLYQWLATRARERLGQLALGLGLLCFAVVYVWVRR